MSTDFIECRPLTPERWNDFETLFGPRGAIGGCWCMWWHQTRSEFEKQKGEPNRQAMHALVISGETPGIIAYQFENPIAWCSVSPRESYPSLSRSRVLKPVDDQPVWSIVCFFVAKGYRRMGISFNLIRAAVDYASKQGARIVEAYPIEPKSGQSPDIYSFTGIASTFRKAGFTEVVRRSETRPIMRYFVI